MHLIRRFFGFLTAKPLTPSEQLHVREVLSPALARAFFGQQSEDQRHAYEVERRANSKQCTQAALLHDIGKSGSRLGAVSRSLATLWSGVGLRPTGRWRNYIDHGKLGSDELIRLGADDLAIAFTRHHPGHPPAGVDPQAWQALEEADNT